MSDARSSNEARSGALSARRPPVAVWACLALALCIALVPGEPSRPEGTAEPVSAAAARAPTPDSASLPDPPEVADQRLAGTVRDTQGRPVPGAIVRARREIEGESERQVPVDDQGAFAIEGIPAGRWLVRAGAPGLSTTARLVEVPGPPVELTIAPVGRIAGRVFGLDGLPAAADVVLAGSGVWPARTVRAGEDGRFVLEDVPPGVYEVQARGAEASAPPRRGLVVEAGARAYLTFHFEPGETLVGRITDAETDQPIAGAEIVVMEESLGVAPRALRSGADGSVRIAGLRAASHRVTVHAEGYVPVVAEEWRPGAPLRIALEPGATLRGVVRDARNRPIEGAEIEVVGDGTSNQPIALDGPSVAFRERIFEAHAAAMPAALGTLEVTSDVPPIPIDGDAPELAAVPSAPTPIAPFRPAAGYVTGADGTFQITGVPPGHVQVVARARGHAPGSSERVWVAPGGERNDVRIVLEPAGRIEGCVVDAAGEPVGGVVIEHRSEGDPWPRTAYADDRGEFALDDVAGAVTLRAMPLDRAPVQVRVDVAPGRTASARIELPAGGPTIAGRTVDERGRAVAHAQVRLESMAPGALPPRVAFSDDFGEFRIPDAPAGPWRLTADHPDYAQGVPVDLDEDATEPLSLVLHPGVTVRGSVLDRMLGDGVAGAEITLEGDGVPPVTRTVRTDEQGSFVIPRALAGRYVATVVSAGHAPWSGPIAIDRTPHGEITLEAIELAPGATLEGDVVDALGQVVRGVEIAACGELTDARPLGGCAPRCAGPRARTDARGHFSLSGLGEGSFVIRAVHPAAGEVSREIRVVAARDPAPVVLRLPRRYDPDHGATERALRHGVAAELEGGEGGVIVASVPAGSRAMRAGLRAGDLVRAVDGEPSESVEDAERLLRGADGVDAVLDLERDGRSFRLRVEREAW